MGHNAAEQIKKVNEDAVIAVLYGGMSNEREVSLRSGKKVHCALIELGYRNAKLIDVQSNVAEALKQEKVEYAFNALHGKYGEDGAIQGLLEILKIPYTASGVKASAVCMDKEFTKKILAENNIPTIESVCVSSKNELGNINLNFPLMVKPASEGSSIGMSKVSTPSELSAAFEEAQKSDKKILIEEYLVGTSCTVGVLEDENGLFATPILAFETKTEWYDYEAKYTQGMTEFILPAKFDNDLTVTIQEIAKKSHKVCECSGVSRVDFLVAGGTPYVLEINTSPGMTDLSDLPAQANEMGINYNNLVQLILNTAGLNK